MTLSEYFNIFPLPDHIANVEVNFANTSLWNEFINVLIYHQNTLSGNSQAAIQLSQNIHKWLISKQDYDNNETLKFLQFNNSITIMGMAMCQKHIPLLYEWTLLSIYPSIPSTIHPLSISEKVCSFIGSDNVFVQNNILYALFEWSSPFYYLISRTGQFRESGSALHLATKTAAYAALPDERALNALLSTLDFSARNDLPISDNISSVLYDRYRNEEFEENHQAQIGIAFSTLIGKKLGRDIAQESEFTLEKYSHIIESHERLQLLIASCNGQISHAIQIFEDLKCAILEYKSFLQRSSPDPFITLYDTGPVFEILFPLIVSAFHNGEISFLTKILQIWKNGCLQESNFNPLYCIPGHPSGLYFGTNESQQLRPIQENLQLKHLVLTLNKCLNLTISINNDVCSTTIIIPG